MIQNSRLPQGYKESALGVIPKDWEVKRFSELFSLKNGINSEKENYGKGVKFVNTLDVLNSPYLTHKLIRGALVVNDEKIKEFAVQYGDILLNRTSETPNEIGYSTVPTQLRVYENKLTLWNHGTLPDGITLDKLTKPHSSFPRNPILAEACFRGGFIDAWGSGIMKIMDSCEMAGLPTPVIEEDCGGLIVRIFKDNLVEEQLVKLELNRRQVKAVLYVKEKGKMTNKEYQELNAISRQMATNELHNLVADFKLLINKGYGAGSHFILVN